MLEHRFVDGLKNFQRIDIVPHLAQSFCMRKGVPPELRIRMPSGLGAADMRLELGD